MPLKQFTTDFQELTKHQYLRFDEKFWFTTKNLATYDYALLKDIFYLLNGNSYTEFYTEEKTDIPYVRIGDLSFKHNIDDKNLIYLDESCEINEDKKLRKDDLILATIGATIGKINLAREFEGGTFSNNTILLRLKDKEKHNPYFYEKLFQSNLLQKYIWGVVSQKAQPNLQSYDLKNVKIPLVAKSIQDQIVAQIEPIEKKIKELKSQITPPQEIINKVFAREFRFNENLYNEFGKGMTAGTQIAKDRTLRTFKNDFSEVARSDILRFSTRFHNIPTKKLMNFLDHIDTLPVKDVVKSYEKGLQPKYDLDGEIPVVKIANLKNSYIDFSETENIAKEAFTQTEDRKKLKQNDIIICATGKISLGKIDFYDYENEAITTVDNYILRLNEKYNPLFFTYFFRSVLGYFQVERDFTGATNQIHLYWDQITNFQIPDIPLKSQQKIVDEIKTELDKQEEMKKKIETQRNKIDEIIKKAVI